MTTVNRDRAPARHDPGMNEPPITSFRGTTFSNFAWVPRGVILDGEVYPTVEHAYQAAKTLDLVRRAHVRGLSTAAKAKREGRKLPLREDWEDVKLAVMLNLLRQKFSTSSFVELLLRTGDRELIEGNSWGDRFWGQSPLGVGENHLGKLLMQVRAELRAAKVEDDRKSLRDLTIRDPSRTQDSNYEGDD